MEKEKVKLTIAQSDSAVTSHSCSDGLRFKVVIVLKRVENVFVNSLVDTYGDHTAITFITNTGTGVDKNRRNQSEKR